jgi:CHAT domain-containing protein
LPGARAEVAAIEGFFPNHQSWVGAAAEAGRLSQTEGDGRCWHLATHGVLDPDNPLDSYLLVSGSPARLTVADIAGLNLKKASLVTLSACQTALAEREPKSNWLASLADAFGFAGSPSVVASLWSVSDTSTRDLMVEFYRNLTAGRGRAQALRQAQLKLLHQEATSHPFHWAAFELIGDWR